MEYDLNYLHEKLSTLIYHLLIDEGTSKQRLSKYLGLFQRAFGLTFPNELEQKKVNVINQLTKFPEVLLDNKVIMDKYQNTLSKIRNSTASSIINDIYEIHIDVNILRAELNDLKKNPKK